MTGLAALWLPILLSAVVVFLASSVLHMAVPWHKHDFAKAPDEDKLIAALRPLALPPGDYMTPCPADMRESKTPEFTEKLQRGPVMVYTVLPNGPFSMGRNLALWFIYCVVVEVFGAYIAGRALPPGAEYLHVFRFAGATVFIGFSLALWQQTIWFRRAWAASAKATVDGLIYGLLSGGVFGWLWPR